jgi:NADH:ubiquinone oxidoreductase subunit 2 (subunit N)
MKLYYDVFSEIFYIYHTFFILVAVLSMLVGSIGAIYQVKLKRLLTYSMITNTGYVMLGLSLGDLSGVFVTILCLLSYIFITFGLFFSLVSMRDWTNNTLVSRINVFTDLFGTNPYLAFNIFILIFSLAGIPPLLGFYSKFFLFLFTLKLKIY